MEGAWYMRLHRSQVLQDSVMVPLYFLAAGPYGSAAIFLARRMSGWWEESGFVRRSRLRKASVVWVPSEGRLVALDLDCELAT